MADLQGDPTTLATTGQNVSEDKYDPIITAIVSGTDDVDSMSHIAVSGSPVQVVEND